MRNQTILQAVFILFAFTNCGGESIGEYREENSKIYSERLKIVPAGEVSFPLDTVTSLLNSNIGHFFIDGNPMLSVFNSYNYQLTLYDFQNRQVKKRISFSKDGENGIGPNTFGFAMVIPSANNIYLLNCASHKIYLTDSFGVTKKKYDISFLRNKHQLYFNNYAQAIIAEDSILYLPCYTVNYFDKGLSGIRPILKFNLNNETYECVGAYPEIYDQATYGVGEEIRLSVALNKHSGLAFSFPRDQHLNLIVDKDSVFQQFIGSRYFDRIEPFENERLNSFIRKSKVKKLRSYTRQAPFYLSLQYIEPFNAFLRITLFENGRSESQTDNSYNKEVSFILADSSFNKIGETFIGSTSDLDFTYPVVIKDTIYIVNRRKYNENDNMLSLVKFSVVRTK